MQKRHARDSHDERFRVSRGCVSVNHKIRLKFPFSEGDVRSGRRGEEKEKPRLMIHSIDPLVLCLAKSFEAIEFINFTAGSRADLSLKTRSIGERSWRGRNLRTSIPRDGKARGHDAK